MTNDSADRNARKAARHKERMATDPAFRLHQAALRREQHLRKKNDPVYREKMRARDRARSARRIAAKRAWLTAYLADHPCVDCGEADRVVLEFDHVRPGKRYEVSKITNGSWSVGFLSAEVALCEVRCANCHRRVTHARRLAQHHPPRTG